MSKELELKPWLLKSGKISNSDKWVLDVFLGVNPKLEQELRNNNLDIKDVCSVTKIYKNPLQTNKFKYNTIAEIETDGCHLVDKEGGPLTIIFAYGRVDLALLEFSQTETVGVPDVPFIVKDNTAEGIRAAYYNLVDGVEFLGDAAEYEGVKKWKVKISEDNRAAIFTRWEKKVRKYYNEFVVFAKQYEGNSNFNNSDYLGDNALDTEHPTTNGPGTGSSTATQPTQPPATPASPASQPASPPASTPTAAPTPTTADPAADPG